MLFGNINKYVWSFSKWENLSSGSKNAVTCLLRNVYLISLTSFQEEMSESDFCLFVCFSLSLYYG